MQDRVGRIKWGANGRHRLEVLDAGCSLKGSGTAEGMADEQLGSAVIIGKPLVGADDIGHVFTETGFMKITCGLAQAGKIKPEAGNGLLGEGFTHSGRRGGEPRASKTVGKKGVGDWFGVGHVNGAGHGVAGRTGQLNTNRMHEDRSLS